MLGRKRGRPRGSKNKLKAGPVPEHQELPVEHQELPVQHRMGRFWPEGEPLPTTYKKHVRRAMPCPKCRRVLTDVGGQAAICRSSGADMAYFQCKVCDHRWGLGVENVGEEAS